MPSPWLTIVTVTKSDPAGLARTLASAESWRRRPGVEQVVVHAGAPPASLPGDVRAAAQSGLGIAAAYNEGLACARGEWVWFLNGGDAIHEELDAAWLEAWLRRTAAVAVFGAVHHDGEPAARPHPPLGGQRLWLRCWPQHPAAIARRDALRAAGGFDAAWSIAMDYDLWLRLLAAEPVVDVVSLPMARFDVTGLSSCADSAPALRREIARLVWRERGRLAAGLFREAGGLARALARAWRHL
jgi:hypothetical protein